MAGPDFEAKITEGDGSLKLLESEGVEFLQSREGKVPLSSCNGKTIVLLFSANWCRPCRTFIPHLIELYDTLLKKDKNLEIIFISLDRNVDGFEEHLMGMPWLAVPFDLSLQKRLTERFHIDRIPSFIPLSLESDVIADNLIEFIEDYGAEAFPFTKKRKGELKALDKRKRAEGNLEELLAHEGRKFVISRDDKKVPVSGLNGKTVGLYFSAHWCPPCHAFTAQLTDAYKHITTAHHQSFEIVLVSTDRDLKEFKINISTMPWLAIPYEDRTRHDLCRIFDIKGLPTLVLIGPDGKVITSDGRYMISSYGAKAFPFTNSRIKELEEALRREGEALAQQVKDVKHEHVLKLDMAKAYVCDCCKQQGKFWAFSCDVCDYDLHPKCVEQSLDYLKAQLQGPVQPSFSPKQPTWSC